MNITPSERGAICYALRCTIKDLQQQLVVAQRATRNFALAPIEIAKAEARCTAIVETRNLLAGTLAAVAITPPGTVVCRSCGAPCHVEQHRCDCGRELSRV